MRAGPSTRVAVLLVDDQQHGRSPEHCVKTGVATSEAVDASAADLPGAAWWQLLAGATLTRALATLLRRPQCKVVIGVSARAWDIWRFRVGTAIVIAMIGAGIAAGGLVGDHPGFAVAGAVLFVAATVLRIWSAWRCWFGRRYRHHRGQVLVHRASAAFDADARRLFVAAQVRRR